MIINAFRQLLSRQEAVRFDHCPLAVDPLGFNRVEPGALAGQQTRQNADAAAGLLNLLVVSLDPAPNLLALMPGSIVPDQQQGRLALGGQPLTTPGQELRGDGTDGTTAHKPQQHLLRYVVVGSNQQAITGQGLRVGIVFSQGQFLQPQRLIRFGPAMQTGIGQPAPPDFIGEAQGPGRLALAQPDQAVSLFFLTRTPGLDW